MRQVIYLVLIFNVMRWYRNIYNPFYKMIETDNLPVKKRCLNTYIHAESRTAYNSDICGYMVSTI